jgi:hypothetical protein
MSNDNTDETGEDSIEERLASLDGVSESDAETLVDAGFASAADLAASDVVQLSDLDGIDAETASEVLIWAGEHAVDARHEHDPEQGQSPDANPRGSGRETGPQTRVLGDLFDDGDGSDDGEEEADESGASRPRQIGERVGAGAAAIPALILSLLGGIAFGILGKIPKRTAVYQKMIKMGYTALYKKTDAHVVANTVYGDGKLIPRPAEHDKETGHLETNNGEWWTATSGLRPVRIGDVPVVTGVADHHELVDPVAARIAEAADMGPSRYVRTTRTAEGVEPAAIADTPGADDATNGHAVADGSGGVQPAIPCEFDDIWLDTSNPVDDNDGMIVSMSKAYELHWDQGSSEEMENQETRGMLAVQETGNERKTAMIYLLIFLGGMAAAWGLLGPLAGAVGGAGGGGGGGGGIGIGLTLMPDLLALVGV